MELTAAYGMFANGGIYNEPVVITKIVDWKGKVLLERFQEARQARSGLSHDQYDAECHPARDRTGTPSA